MTPYGHLEPVTHPENCHRGAGTKLTAVDVRDIRRALAQRVPGVALALRFGVSSTTISQIKHRHKWASV